MGKSKRRILHKGQYNQISNMSRETAIMQVVENINDKSFATDLITLFGLGAEELLEYGATYEDVVSFGGILE